MESLIGKTLDGRYLVQSQIGSGAMGAVYKAQHIAMAQPVALKFLLTDRANDPSMVERFIREARHSFKIDHPNCVRITDFCAMDDGTLFIVMEYLDGRTVGKEVAVDGPMASSRVRHIAAQTAEALHHAHSLGLVHRDLKPDNMMLLQRGADCDFTKVFDFGLAKLFDEGVMLTGLSMSPLTQSGIVFGTPSYMAPEQALGGEIGPASDIYTLGVCCFEMLTGTVPFEGETFTSVLSMHVQASPKAPSELRPDLIIEPELEALVMRCLQKESKARPSAMELAAALRGHASTGLPARATGNMASSETIVLKNPDLPAANPSATLSRLGPTSTETTSTETTSTETTSTETTSTETTSTDEYDESLDQVPTRPWPKTLLLIPAGIVVLVVFTLMGGGSDGTGKTEASGIDSKQSGQTQASPVQGVKADAGAALLDASMPDARLPDAAPKNQGATKPRKRNTHLVAAEAAYRGKKPLKQLIEAQAALEAEPKNRRAAFLAGDALLKSGDKVRACGFFRRASRKHYRANGCGN